MTEHGRKFLSIGISVLIERLKDTAAIVMTSQEPEKMIQTSGTERFVEKE
jgi:hypothetical protein